PRWRRFLVSRVSVPPGGRILDVATGTGAVAIELGKSLDAGIVGLDQSQAMLREGVRRAAEVGMGAHIGFVLGQAERLPFGDQVFDALTFTYLLRYAAQMRDTREGPPPRTEHARRLFAGLPGTYDLMGGLLSFGQDPRWRRFLVSRVSVPPGGRILDVATGFYREYPMDEQLGMWRRAGIADVRSRVMSAGAAVVVWGTKRG
ncbi:MAG: methyltransferase domain-containing protein, partial [Actinobacteria bacterium]